MTQKILICDQHGGFGLSRAAFHRLRELGSQTALTKPDIGEYFPDGSGPRKDFLQSFCSEVNRDDPLLIQVFEEMGDKTAARLCRLALIEIPDDVSWHVEEYDGLEWVAEDHRTWGAG